MTTKVCYTCKGTKDLSEFYGNPQKADGLSTYCKVCFRARQAKHYRDKNPTAPKPEGMKHCARCETWKPVDAFGMNRKNPDGRQYSCKPCQVEAVTISRRKDPTAHRRSSKAWREKNLERHADNNAKRSYGVAHGTYQVILEAQESRCAICGTTEPGARLTRFHIDHDHETGKVRGLLCSKCNTGLGQFNDSPDILSAAIEYLRSRR